MPNYKNIQVKPEVYSALTEFKAALSISYGEAIEQLLEENRQVHLIVGYLQDLAQKSDGDVQIAYLTALAWFELAGLVQAEAEKGQIYRQYHGDSRPQTGTGRGADDIGVSHRITQQPLEKHAGGSQRRPHQRRPQHPGQPYLEDNRLVNRPPGRRKIKHSHLIQRHLHDIRNRDIHRPESAGKKHRDNQGAA